MYLHTWTDYFYWAEFLLYIFTGVGEEVSNQSGALFLAM